MEPPMLPPFLYAPGNLVIAPPDTTLPWLFASAAVYGAGAKKQDIYLGYVGHAGILKTKTIQEYTS